MASVSKGEYRYGFNGKETDNETGLQDYGERIYNSSIAKFLSADPLIVKGKQYPELSPYQFASNTPIQAIDLDGLEAAFILIGGPINSTTNPVQSLNTSVNLAKNLSENLIDAYTHLITRGGAAFINGVSYGYGDIKFDNGNATNLKLGYLRFNWENGFINPGYSFDNSVSLSSNSQSLSYEDGKNIMLTISTIVLFPVKATTPLEKVAKFGIKPLLKTGLNYLDNNSEQNQSLIKTHTVSGDGVRIRSGAGTDNSILGLLYTGEGVIATGNIDGEWSEVSTNSGTTGWVHSSFLNSNKESTEE
jgi:RHS repeat-associated protein